MSVMKSKHDVMKSSSFIAWVYTLASCVTSTGMSAKNAATILKPLVPNSPSTPIYMVQHVTNSVAPFLLPLPSNSSILSLHLPPLLP